MDSIVPVDLDLLRDHALTPDAKYLYMVLLSLCRPGARTCIASQGELVRLSGIASKVSVRTHIRALVSAGWLQVRYDPARRQSEYLLLNPRHAERYEAVEDLRRRIDRAPHRGEALMRAGLDLNVDRADYLDNARPDFLVNPLTGERLEYDRYYPPDVAVEFNGPQHYGPTERFPDPARAKLQQTRDLIKQALSQKNGVKLVVIGPADLTVERIRRKLSGLLPLRSLAGQEHLVAELDRLCQRYRREVLPRSRAGRASATSHGA